MAEEHHSNSETQVVLGHHPLFQNPIVPSKPQWEQLCLSTSQVIGKISEKGFTRITFPSGGLYRATGTGKDCFLSKLASS